MHPLRWEIASEQFDNRRRRRECDKDQLRHDGRLCEQILVVLYRMQRVALVRVPRSVQERVIVPMILTVLLALVDVRVLRETAARAMVTQGEMKRDNRRLEHEARARDRTEQPSQRFSLGMDGHRFLGRPGPDAVWIPYTPRSDPGKDTSTRQPRSLETTGQEATG
jgi:hypothetical protein